MSSLAQVAVAQIQAHRQLKQTLEQTPAGFRELASSVNPENLERRSADIFMRLREGIDSLAKQAFVEKTRKYNNDMSYGMS